MISEQPDYWQDSAPWWEALRHWENDQPLTEKTLSQLQTIQKETLDRRVAQLCHFLRKIAAQETAMVQQNDSFTQYLLKRRNARRLRKLSR